MWDCLWCWASGMPSRPCSQAAASHSIWSRGKAPYKSKTRADRGREREVAKQCRCLPCEHTHFITLFGLFTSLDCRVVSSFSALTPFPSLSLSFQAVSPCFRRAHYPSSYWADDAYKIGQNGRRAPNRWILIVTVRLGVWKYQFLGNYWILREKISAEL